MAGELYIIPNKDRIDEELVIASKYNAAFEYNDFYMPDILDDEKRLDELIDFYVSLPRDRSNDTMHGAFLDVTIHSTDSLIRNASEYRIRQSMDIAKRLGIHKVIVHTGRLNNFRLDYYLKNWLDMNEAFFRKVLAEYPDMEIYMENMFDEAPDVMAELAGRMKDEERFGLCLDYAHGAISSVPCEEWVKQLAPYIRHIHINDNDLVNDSHQQMGTGKINWQEFNSLMREYNITSSVLLEVKDVDVQADSLKFMTENKIYPMK